MSKYPKITVSSISDTTGENAPLAGLNGELGRLALESQLQDVSGNLQNQIDNIDVNSVVVLGGAGAQVVEGPDKTFTVSVSGDYATNTALQSLTNTVIEISGNYATMDDINDFVYTSQLQDVEDSLETQIQNVSGNLQDQIDNIIQESTVIESSGGSIIVTQIGNEFNLEVASAPIQDHNLLTGLQGGTSGEYYHLSELQYNDYIGKTEVQNVSGDLQNQIDAIVQESTDIIGGSGISVIESPIQTFTISVSGDYATNTLVQNVSGQLAIDITNSESLTYTTIQNVSGNLQDQIDSIIQESTVIESSGGSIIVTQIGNAFNLEVASAPIQDHNLLTGLQGGTSGEYYHLTGDQFSDYIGKTEVANISGDLQDQIDNIVQESTSIIGGDGISVIESHEHNFTVSVSGDYATTTFVGEVSGNLQNAINDVSDWQNSFSLVAGDNIQISELDNVYTISASISGDENVGIYGIEPIPIDQDTVSISHPNMDVSIPPIITLSVPTANSDLTVLGVFNRSETGFDVVLSGVVDVSGYFINWAIPFGGSYGPQELDTELSYNIDGQLETYTTSAGTKTFSYNLDGQLVSIVGTGIYVSKNFIYNLDGQLTNVEVI
jgi:hypothetical protein